MRSTAAPYTESRLTRSVANERVGFPVVEHKETKIYLENGKLNEDIHIYRYAFYLFYVFD